ncbi:MAG: cupin domain-containing protein [Candidatus Bathyarchaeia archaeon]
MEIVNPSSVKRFTLLNQVEGRIVLNGDRMMFLLVELPPRGVVPEHSHPHEQMGLCLKGKAEFRTDSEQAIVEEGMFYRFRSGEKHSVISLVDGPSLFLDVFSPPREDYLEKARQAK